MSPRVKSRRRRQRRRISTRSTFSPRRERPFNAHLPYTSINADRIPTDTSRDSECSPKCVKLGTDAKIRGTTRLSYENHVSAPSAKSMRVSEVMRTVRCRDLFAIRSRNVVKGLMVLFFRRMATLAKRNRCAGERNVVETREQDSSVALSCT